MLDNMTEAQVIYVLQRDHQARQDLLRITTDDHLRQLALTVPMLPSVEEMDEIQTLVNDNAGSIPFYSIFRGQPPFAQ